jgi:hypothetical protein
VEETEKKVKDGNGSLHRARKNKNDEFYTSLDTVEEELQYYKQHFKNKVVLCNCDDVISNFWKYFHLNFTELGLKKLIGIAYRDYNISNAIEYKGGGDTVLINTDDNQCNKIIPFNESNGDFRSEECIEILKEADIVVTNPPFSLFREYFQQLIDYNKKFLIIGSNTAVCYGEIFKHIKDGTIWLGLTCGHKRMYIPDEEEIIKRNEKKLIKIDAENRNKWVDTNIRWYTNLYNTKRKNSIVLTKNYTPDKYPKYDNVDAINVDNTEDIPCDYYGLMGVPVSFLNRYNEEQFEIVGKLIHGYKPECYDLGKPSIDGKVKFTRIAIRRRQQNTENTEVRTNMQITQKNIKVKDLASKYRNNAQTSQVEGYDGKLNIRPAYQREFIYTGKQQEEVIKTILKGFPLNVMYWADNGNDTYEVIDGQQRTISICEYITGNFSIKIDGLDRYFHNLTPEEQNKILEYELLVYWCKGTNKEKLDWFKIINIAGEKLTDQELRNAVYTGNWLSDAKLKFSAKKCPAYNIAKDYLTGSPIRQEYLETVLGWICEKEGLQSVEKYMAIHQKDANAGKLWSYFTQVISWVKEVFPVVRKEMKGVDWGYIFNNYGNKFPDSAQLEEQVQQLMQDGDITNKKGIYVYLASDRDAREEKNLHLRAFDENTKREVYEKQNHKCPYCEQEGKDKEYNLSEMEADHIIPWSKGGKTTIDNCQMLCKEHNRQKSNK